MSLFEPETDHGRHSSSPTVPLPTPPTSRSPIPHYPPVRRTVLTVVRVPLDSRTSRRGLGRGHRNLRYGTFWITHKLYSGLSLLVLLPLSKVGRVPGPDSVPPPSLLSGEPSDPGLTLLSRRSDVLTTEAVRDRGDPPFPSSSPSSCRRGQWTLRKG